MKKKFVVVITILGIICSAMQLFSQETTLKELLRQHKAKVKELAQFRQRAISEDEELKELHDQILELHAKLSLKLEQKPEIKKLNDEIINLEKEIDAQQSENEKKKLLKNE